MTLIIRKKRAVKKAPKKRGARRARDVPDMASLSVTRTVIPQGANNFVTNTMYSADTTDLASFDRAVQVAKAYQHYRIKKITLTLKPSYDTFQQGAAGAAGSRPNIYYMIDKSGSIPNNPNLEQLKQMGAKPRRFDEKPFVISWRPSVLDVAQQAAGGVFQSAQYKISPWLSTSANPMGAVFAASTIDHLGVYWFVEQLFGGGVQYGAELEVQFQFKKPLWYQQGAGPVPPMAIPIMVADQDNSADGIVGGPDSNNNVVT